MSLIEEKRAVYRSTVIGESVEATDDASVAAAIIARFAGKAA